MVELFVFGTFWFWVLLLAELFLLFVFVEYENGLGATISLLIFAALLQWCGNVDILGYASSNPLKLMLVILSYFVLGTIWGVVKWWVWCRERRERYDELKAEFCKNEGIDSLQIPLDYRGKFKRWIEGNRKYGDTTPYLYEIPHVRDNKARITRWMSFWFVSMIWTFLDDVIKKIFQNIYRAISGYLQRIADAVFAGVKDDIS